MADQFFYNIPISFRFDPTDEELIREYLLPKVMGFPLPWNGIVEKELYGDNALPWDVFSDIDDDSSFSLYCNKKRESGKTKKTVYVFTKVTKAAPNSKKRIARRAGCGTWNGQTGSKDIIDSTTGDIIGCTKTLSFQYSKKDIGDFGHWIMHEYSLTGEWKTDVVLCRITKCIKNSPLRPINIPVVAKTNKRVAEDQESGGKKQKIAAEADWNLMDSDDNGKSNVQVVGGTLTAGDIERILIEDDDDEKSNNHEVEGCTCTLTAKDREKILMEDDDEKSRYEVEGCTFVEESAATLPLSSTTTGDGITEEENGGENGNSTLSYRLDDDVGLVFSHLNLDIYDVREHIYR